MRTFIILLAFTLASVAQAHTTGQRHVHLSCPGDQHCPAVTSDDDHLPTPPDKAKTSDKEH
jgi:hypothetical protein